MLRLLDFDGGWQTSGIRPPAGPKCFFPIPKARHARNKHPHKPGGTRSS